MTSIHVGAPALRPATTGTRNEQRIIVTTLFARLFGWVADKPDLFVIRNLNKAHLSQLSDNSCKRLGLHSHFLGNFISKFAHAVGIALVVLKNGGEMKGYQRGV